MDGESREVPSVHQDRPADAELGHAWDQFYDVPIARETLAAFSPEAARTRYSIRLSPENVVEALVDLTFRGNVLHVILHGAVRTDDRYPRFDRVTTTARRRVPFVCIADPFLRRNGDVLLAWYAGSADFDYTPHLIEIVRRAMEACGATRVLFVGGSGGGFASMQLASQLENAFAFVLSPQTRVTRYYPGPVKAYVDAAFPGLSPKDAEEAYPDRLSVIDVFATGRFAGLGVYYLQNRLDRFHVEHHLEPLANLLRVPIAGGRSKDGRVEVTLEDMGEGHMPPTPAQFDGHLHRALRMMGEGR